MRYEKLSIPLAGGLFEITFHQNVTVLAGLGGKDRAALIDAFAAAAAGSVPGGTLVFRDQSGRRIAIRDFQLVYLDGENGETSTAMAVHADAKAMRTMLCVGADDLGLPRPMDDPSLLALQEELIETRADLAKSRGRLKRFQDNRIRRDRVLQELTHTEETLANLGSPTDRYLHERARDLVELEQIRAKISAVQASPQERERDARLLAAADGVQGLADEWAAAGTTLDDLRVKFRDRERLSSSEIATLVDLPDEAPAGLTPVIAEYESASARADHLAAELDALKSGRTVESPDDSRILVLSTVDQETLWMAHRRARMATVALDHAIAAEQAFAAEAPELVGRAEEATALEAATAERSERLWLRGMLATTILICLGILVPTAGFGVEATPALFLAAAVMFTWLVLIPKVRHRKAAATATAILAEAGASNIEEFRQRYADGPESSRWHRADQIVEEYESAMEEWRFLVGDLTVDEVGELEERVLDWAEASSPEARKARLTSLERSLQHARSDRDAAARTLQSMLRPLGLHTDALTVATSAAVHERIQRGRFARLQVALGEAEEVENKLKNRLADLLAAIGFEAGTLEARIGAFGWAIDGARRRQLMQQEAPSIDDLTATRDRLEARLAHEPPPVPSDDQGTPEEGPHIVTLRARRDELRAEASTLKLGDEDAEARRIAKLEARTASLEAELSPEAGMLVARPVDHLVETLVRFRPSWPSAPGEPLPALLDDPFKATPEGLRIQLLNALGEVSKVTQVVLFTDDEAIAAWARTQSARGAVSLLEPA